MNTVFVAGVWFVLGLVVCFLSGRGITNTRTPNHDEPVADAGPRRFATLAVHEWALVAECTAIEELLAPRPGVPSGKV